MKRAVGLLLVVLVAGGPASAEWQADPDDRRQVKSARAIEAILEKHPSAQQYFDEAYGFAVLPSVTRIGLGFGGAHGKGFVIEGDRLVGRTSFWQFSSGLQGGAQNFSMFVFFRDKEALDYFREGEIQFIGQGAITAGTVGIASTPAWNEGVAILTVAPGLLVGHRSDRRRDPRRTGSKPHRIAQPGCARDAGKFEAPASPWIVGI